MLCKAVIGRIVKQRTGWKKWSIQLSIFLLAYLSISQLIIPIIAGSTGRVPLPRFDSRLKPASTLTWIFNRNYVKPELKALLIKTSSELPINMSIVYLDACFPFIDGFPLPGHLSHNDGEKVDLAFVYTNASGEFLNKGKSFSGYGIVESAGKNEVSQAEICEKQGYWQYSIMTKLTAYERFKDFDFNNAANRILLTKLTAQPGTGKIFIEPHLEKRLRLENDPKIRFHGCHAARHDDHIHLQL